MNASVRLRSLLLVAVSAAAPALLVLFTGDLPNLWPLFGLPIVVASIEWGVSGTLVVSSLVAAGFALLVLGEQAVVRTVELPGLLAGMAAFTVGGVLIGLNLHHQELRVREAERAAVRDPLTGIYDRDYFQARLKEELGRAQRYGSPIGLVIFDVDGLREFNDTFGQYKGDMLIRHMAEILRLSTRESDVLARWNGGSFAVLLPHAGPNEAALVAERLRAAIEKADFEGDELEPATRRTVSGGAVAFPAVATNAEDLIEQARATLADAKAAGGNRIAARGVTTTDDTRRAAAAPTAATPPTATTPPSRPDDSTLVSSADD